MTNIEFENEYRRVRDDEIEAGAALAAAQHTALTSLTLEAHHRLNRMEQHVRFLRPVFFLLGAAALYLANTSFWVIAQWLGEP